MYIHNKYIQSTWLLLFVSILLFYEATSQNTNEKKSSVNGRIFYVDPVNGSMENNGSKESPWSTLQEVVFANLIETQQFRPLPYNEQSELVTINENAPIQAGDTIILKQGLHGALVQIGAYNSVPITILGAEGEQPVLSKIVLSAVSNWNIKNVNVSGEPFGSYSKDWLIKVNNHDFNGPSSDIIIEKCEVFSTENSENWSKNDWLEKVTNGIFVEGENCIVKNNKIVNIYHGIIAEGRACKVLQNKIVNFAGDGIRPLAPAVVVEGNLIKNCYDIDDNHDDGIQSYNLGRYDVRDIVIRGNMILNYTDPNQPLSGPLQGIGCFDGPYYDWIVENNVVWVNHWHGITFMEAHNCTIANNTVVDPTPTVSPGPSWIKIDKNKNGTPSSNCVVVNNIANSFFIEGESINNLKIDSPVKYQQNFVNASVYNFHLKPGSIAIDAANNYFLPETDFDQITRPQGEKGDIGAFEFIVDASSMLFQPNNIQVFPNPGSTKLFVEFPSKLLSKNINIDIYNSFGKLIKKENHFSKQTQNILIDIQNLQPGMYFIKTNYSAPIKFIKI